MFVKSCLIIPVTGIITRVVCHTSESIVIFVKTKTTLPRIVVKNNPPFEILKSLSWVGCGPDSSGFM